MGLGRSNGNGHRLGDGTGILAVLVVAVVIIAYGVVLQINQRMLLDRVDRNSSEIHTGVQEIRLEVQRQNRVIICVLRIPMSERTDETYARCIQQSQ